MLATILLASIIVAVLALVAIGYYAATHSSTPNPTPTATPTSTPASTQEKVRDQIMQYIKTNHSETGQFMNDLIWTGGRATPVGLIGSETYSYFSSGWNVTMTYPVVPNPIYKVTADYSAPSVGIPYRIVWEGTWQNEAIAEKAYTFAQ